MKTKKWGVKLSFKIVALSILILFLVSLAFSFFTLYFTYNNGISAINQNLQNTAAVLKRGILPSPNGIGGNVNPSVLQGEFYVAVLDDSGNIIQTSYPRVQVNGNEVTVYAPPKINSLNEYSLDKIETFSANTDFNAQEILYSDVDNLKFISADTKIVLEEDSWQGMFIQNESPITQKNQNYIFLALSRATLNQELQSLLEILITLSLIVMIFGSSAIFVTIKLSLRPLKKIEKSAQQISSGSNENYLLPHFLDITKAPNTEIGSLQISLNEMLKKIQNAFLMQQNTQNQMKRFISDSSHELRTPLAIIKGYLDIYQAGIITDQEGLQDLLSKIKSASDRMNGLVQNLITLTRLDEEQNIQLQPQNIVNYLIQTTDELHALDPQREIVLRINDSEILNTQNYQYGTSNLTNNPLEIIADLDDIKIQQVFTNLIGNINKYTPSGSPVEIQLKTYEKDFEIIVSDFGPGITQDIQDINKIFDRFFVTEESRSSEISGSGLGLSIVKVIIEKMHGKIWAQNNYPHGLQIHIILPYHN